MKALPISRLLSITTMGFALGMVSATLEPALLGYKVLELRLENRNTILGLITFVGLIIASLTQPLMGALSDRTQSRLGRRLPYLIAGVILLTISLIWIAAAPTFAFLLIGMMFLQFSSNTIQGPWQALVPDLVSDEQRGLASGFKLLCEGGAAVIGRVVAGYLIGFVPIWGQAAVGAAITVPALCLMAGLIITARGTSTLPSKNLMVPQQSIRAAIEHTFSVDWRAYPAFGWWFLNRLFFWCAMIAVSIFLLFFVIDVVGTTEAQAQQFIGQASAILGSAVLLCAIPASRLADRVPRAWLVFASGLIACMGTLIVLLTREFGVIMVGGALIGGAVGLYNISSWALITGIVPRPAAAHYLGIANIATAIGSGIARLVGGTLIDAVNSAQASRSFGYLTVYAIAAGLFLLSALVMIPLRSSQPVPR